MTSVREAVRRLLGFDRSETLDPSAFSYTIYWTKEVRTWEAEKRRQVRETLEAEVQKPGFVPDAHARAYSVPQVDDSQHSGASLIALLKVIKAFDEGSTSRGDEG